MTIADGFALWIGKALADLAIGIGVVVLFMTIAAIVAWWGKRK